MRWEYARFEWYHNICHILFSHVQGEAFLDEAAQTFARTLREEESNDRGLTFNPRKVSIQDILFFMGESGWELCSVAKAEWDDITLFFKRPIAENETPSRPKDTLFLDLTPAAPATDL